MLALTAAALAGEYLGVGLVGDGCELLAEAERLHPDVIVLDIQSGAPTPALALACAARFRPPACHPGQRLRIAASSRPPCALDEATLTPPESPDKATATRRKQ